MWANGCLFQGRDAEAEKLFEQVFADEAGHIVLMMRYPMLSLLRFNQRDYTAAMEAAGNWLAISQEFRMAHLTCPFFQGHS